MTSQITKPFFTDKMKTKSEIKLIKKKIFSRDGQEEIVSEEIISEYQAVKKIFVNIVRNMKISSDHGYETDFITADDKVTNAANEFKNHASIIMIENRKKMV